jgi:hypothetical protein
LLQFWTQWLSPKLYVLKDEGAVLENAELEVFYGLELLGEGLHDMRDGPHPIPVPGEFLILEALNCHVLDGVR